MCSFILTFIASRGRKSLGEINRLWRGYGLTRARRPCHTGKKYITL
jgi:hypothetical protein